MHERRAAITFAGWVGSGIVLDCYLARKGCPWSTWIRRDWSPRAKVGLVVVGVSLATHVCACVPHDPLTIVGQLLAKGRS